MLTHFDSVVNCKYIYTGHNSAHIHTFVLADLNTVNKKFLYPLQAMRPGLKFAIFGK